MANGKKKTARPEAGGDRFIPVRDSKHMEVASFLIRKINDVEEATPSLSGNNQKAWSLALNDFDIEKVKIMNVARKPFNYVDGFRNHLEAGYSKVPQTASTRKSRHISSAPETVLDVPQLRDDFYLNLMDWGKQNLLAVALEDCVYLWNAKLKETVLLKQMEEENGYISSVSWSNDGSFLAIGTSECKVELWDVQAQRRLRNMSGHHARVSCLNWNRHILSSGSRSGLVHQHDVRLADHHLTTLRGHTQEVCGLSWSPDGRYLASGGNDNLVNVWRSVQGRARRPLHTFREHRGAVKALAWCPWRPGILASGGGSADRHVRIWNVNNGSCVTSWDTQFQVSSLVFAPNYKELVSGHGFTSMFVWNYPSFTKVAELKGHEGRVLSTSLSPDGSVLASIAADETIRLWNCFQREPTKEPMPLRSSIFQQQIR